MRIFFVILVVVFSFVAILSVFQPIGDRGDTVTWKINGEEDEFLQLNEVALWRTEIPPVGGGGSPVSEREQQDGLRLWGEGGEVVAGAEVFFWTGEILHASLLSDENGFVIPPPFSKEGGFVVRLPGWTPLFFVAKLGGWPKEAKIVPKLTFSGRFLCTNASVAWGEISIRAVDLSKLGISGLPKRVKQDLAAHGVYWDSDVLKIDQQGNFELNGLEEDWEGRLLLPRNLTIRSYSGMGVTKGGETLDIHNPFRGLEVDVLFLHSLIGRIVSPDGEQGLAGVPLEMVIGFDEEGELTQRFAATSSDDGNFEVVLHPQFMANLSDGGDVRPQNPHNVGVSIQGTREWSGMSTSVNLLGHDGPWDIGDFVVGPRNMREFQVLDENGNPIPGALAYSAEMSAPTSDKGRSTFLVMEGVRSAWACAEGYEMERLDLILAEEEPLIFTLAPASRLEISWEHPPESIVEGVELIILCDSIAFTDFDEIESREVKQKFFMAITGQKVQSARRHPSVKGGKFEHQIQGLPEGAESVFLWGLRPEVAFEARLIGPLGGTIAKSSSITISPKEHRIVVLSDLKTLVSLEGRMVDGNGNPVSGVNVAFIEKDGWGKAVLSKEDGSFIMKGVIPGVEKLQMRKKGYYAPFEIKRHSDDFERDFVIDKARELLIFIHDSRGKVYSDTGTRFSIEKGIRIQETLMGNGGFLLQDIPESEFLLTWRINGSSGEEWIEENSSIHEIEISVMGSLTAHITRSNVEKSERIKVRLYQLGEDGEGAQTLNLPGKVANVGQEEIELFGTVLRPGNYSAQLFLWKGDGVFAWEGLGEIDFLEIIAGELSEIVFDY